MADTLLVWLDIETTGLDWDSDYLLELASAVTDLDGHVFGRFAEVVSVGAPVAELGMAPAVEAMHRDSGLLGRVEAAGGVGRDEDTVVDAWLEWAAGWAEGSRLILAGSGIARFDIPWVQSRRGNETAWPFYWREFDISGALSAFRWCGAPVELGPRPHTAGGDVEQIIAEWRVLAARIRAGVEAGA